MIDKNTQVDNLIKDLKAITNKSIKGKKYNKALSAISLGANILYKYNQYYTDDDFENSYLILSDMLKKEFNLEIYSSKEKTKRILFYDGFGFDDRGSVLIYLNALCLKGYEVCYVTNKNSMNKIPKIEMLREKIEIVYIDMSNLLNWSYELSQVFKRVKPKAAFFYTYPYDVSGCIAFSMFDLVCDRYLIDLTDHAFWLGKKANDYFIGSRNMSAYLQHYERGIDKEKCIKLDINLLIENELNHDGLPFSPESNRYIFSGGSLYKTLGDPENKYYKIVRHILLNNPDIKFLYAGNGDKTELLKIIKEFPNRAFYTDERKDFYYLISHCLLYLNTYPMFGGMMMRYAANAHRIPITLKHNNDSEGILLNQEECKIEYEQYEDLIEDVDLLIQNDEYRKQREKMLEGAVLSENEFANSLQDVIEKHSTKYKHDFLHFDTTEFRKEYYNRFEFKKVFSNSVSKRDMSLFFDYPNYYFLGFTKKILKKIKKG